jgi:hypothetical protein
VKSLIAHRWRDCARRRRIFAFTVGAILALMLASGSASRCYADDASAQASQLSDHAFAMLNAMNAASGKPGPMLEPAASLAGDAHALSTALSAHDKAGASSAMGAILSDRDRIEAAAKIVGGRYPNEWDDIREKIAALEKTVPATKGAVNPGGLSSTHEPASMPAVSAAPKMPVAPKIAISSRVFKAGIVRVKGFLEGTDLKSAGIYDGDQKSKDIDVASTPGEQRINFDFSIQQPSPSQSIRVADSYGREASAMIAPDPAGVGAMKGNEELIEVEPGAGSSSGGVATSSGSSSGGSPERLASAGPAVRNNTAEIPRRADEHSPSHRHMNEGSTLGPLTNVQINVIDAEELMSAPGTVEVVGQIAGPGVRRAGIYVNNRLVKSIAVSTSGYSSFDVTFPMPAGSDARIRAYGNGNDFIEASIDTVAGGAGMSEYRNPPMYGYGTYPGYPPSPYYRPNPYAYANPYAPGVNPYAPNPYYGYPPGYGPPPYGTPPYGTPPPNKPWYNKLFH